jgi:hypothetical protein
MPHSSPEPPAGWFGEGLVRRGACRRAPHAERAVMAHSSPEPPARLLGGGLWGEARVRSLAVPGLLGDNRRDAGCTLGLVGRAGWRTPCAERAVILTAVQSLRLAVGI